MSAVQACPEPGRACKRYVAGEVLANKYRLERPLGEGGQGAVWLATNVVLEAAVAVKLVNGTDGKRAVADDGQREDEATLRLLDEARVIARLRHPAIVRVFDVDRTADGQLFVVMELLEGETLRERLDRDRRVDAHEAVRLLLPIADALASAHGQGIVHRDVKPENIFLCRVGDGLRSKLLDFGTVKLPEKQGWRHITADGCVVGTPGYLAPEQVLGHDDLDHRADVWGLCVTLYEMLTGRNPFDGANVQELLRAVVIEEATPVEQFAPCDPRLWRIIARGLAKHPDDRWSSVEELGSALAHWLVSEGIHDDITGVLLERRWFGGRSEADFAYGARSSHGIVVPASKRARVKNVGFGVASVAVALVCAGGWGLSGRSQAAERTVATGAPASERTSVQVSRAAVPVVAAAASPFAATAQPSERAERRVDVVALPHPTSEPTRPRAAPRPRAATRPAPALKYAPASTPATGSPAPAKLPAAPVHRDVASDLIDPY
jgi:serine/threonine-protein kinase